MKILRYLFISLALFGHMAFANPLEWHAFSVLSPLIYLYAVEDTLFAVSEEGLLVPIVVHPDAPIEKRYEKQDSLFLGIDTVESAGWDGKYLYLGGPEGLYRWNRSGGLTTLHSTAPKFLTSDGEKRVTVLFPGWLEVFERGKKVVRFRVPVSTYYASTVNDSMIVTLDSDRVRIFKFSGRLKREFCFPGWHPLTLWKIFREKISYFSPKLVASFGDTLAIAAGFQKGKTDNDFGKTRLLLFSIRKNDTLLTKTILGQIIRLWPDKAGRLLVNSQYGYIASHFVILDVNSGNEVQLSFRSSLDISPIYEDYCLTFSLFSGYTIFTYQNPSSRYRNSLIDQYSTAVPWLRRDLNRDGTLDLVLLGSSTWINAKDAVYDVYIIENYIPREIKNVRHWIRRAREFDNFARCEKGFYYAEKALSVAHYLLPDSVSSYLEIRNRILRKVEQRRLIKRAFVRILGIFPIVVAIVIILVLFIRLRRKQDENRSIPSAETLNFLRGEALFHKITTTMDSLSESVVGKQWEQMVAIRRELESFRKYLMQKKVRYEFLEAPREWRKFYRQILFQISCVIFSTRLIFLLRKIGFFRKVMTRQIQQRSKKILKLKSILQNLIEQSKQDVISAALLPAINDVQRKYRVSTVLIRTQIQVEFPYRYFPDEILKFHRAFLAILENAIEAYDNMEDCSPRNYVIQVQADSNPDELLILIKDNARGIPQEMIAKVFTPGFSYGKDGKDRGFGLSGVKEFFSGYGEIQVTSDICVGTTFRIKLIYGKIPT